MISAGFFENNTALVATFTAVVSASLGFLAYRRSKRSDEVAEKTGTISSVYTGLDKIIANLQADNADLRSRLGRLDVIENELRGLKNRIDTLERFIKNEGLQIPNNGG